MSYQSVAGQFFPYTLDDQKRDVNMYLDTSKGMSLPGKLKALIVPHAGWIYSASVAAVGYKLLQHQIQENKLNKNTSKIVLIGPSHREYFGGVKEGIFDHSVEVQIPFLREITRIENSIPLVYGDLSVDELIHNIKKYMDENTILIVSSDLSHYYEYDKAVAVDSIANETIPMIRISEVANSVEACGKLGILALLTIAQENHWKGKLLTYKNSGDTAGDKNAVVGYGCYGFYE